MILKIDANRPDRPRIQKVVDCLKSGGVIVYPTDTVYTLGCDMHHQKAFERLCALKGTVPKKAQFTAVADGFSQISEYAYTIDNQIFNLMKSKLPGAFTFILHANKRVSKVFELKRKEIGFRIPDHKIPLSIVDLLGNPILSASVKNEDEILEYMTDPREIEEVFGRNVDLVIDGGIGDNVPTTVVDCTKEKPEIIRQGKGVL